MSAQANELQQTMTFFQLDHGSRGGRSAHKSAPPPARSSKAAAGSRMAAAQINDGDFERF